MAFRRIPACLEIGPGFEQSLRVTAANSIVDESFWIQVRHTTFEYAHRLSLNLIGKLIRAFIPPLNTGLLAKDAHFLAMHRSSVHGTRPHIGDGTIVVLHQSDRVVFQRSAAFDE